MRTRVVIEKGGSSKFGPWIENSQLKGIWEHTLGTLTGKDLGGALIGGWMHMFLWGMSDYDRAASLGIVLGRKVDKNEVARAKRFFELKGWEDFPDFYTVPPMRLEFDRQTRQSPPGVTASG